MRTNSRGIGVLVILLVTGAILGGILGELIATTPALGGIAPYLVKTYPVLDIPPMTINLYVIRLTVGFALFPNLVSVIGMIAAIILFQRI